MRGEKITKKLIIGAVAVAMLFTFAGPANALDQPVMDGCYVDWNEDGMLTYADFLQFEPEFGGFYFEWYVMKHWPEIYDETFPNGKPDLLDWNGNGELDYEGDVEGYHSDGFTEGFYLTYATVWVQPTPRYVMYMDYIPEQNCLAVEDLACNYHSDCAADEYCAGDGCSAEKTCDPYFEDGLCTKKRNEAECLTEPIVPTCGCDYGFYLNACQLEAAGVRYQGAGICVPATCPGGLDEECPCGQKCVPSQLAGNQCLPNS